MGWCSLRSINVPNIDVGASRSHFQLAAAGGFIAASSFCLSSARKASPFACLSLFISAGKKPKKVALVTDKAPVALGPYSQSIKVVVLDVWFISKVLIMSVGFYSRPEGHLEQIEDQKEQVTMRLADLKGFKKVNEIYAKFPFADFPSPAPACSTCRVAALPLDAKIEFKCIAAFMA